MIACCGLLTGDLALTCGPSQTVAAPFHLERGRVGSIELGEPIGAVYERVGRERIRLVARFPEGMFQPVLEITLPGSDVDPALVVEIREAPCPQFSVSAIDVFDRRFRTKEGLGIGSSLRELRVSYQTEIASGEGKTYALTGEVGVGFQLSGTRDDAVVISIRIVADPDLVRRRWCPGRRPELRTDSFLGSMLR